MVVFDSKFYPQIRENDDNLRWRLPADDCIRLRGPEWDSVVRTNSLGFRGDIAEGGTLFVGDSFTVSIRVDYENTFLGILDQHLDISNMAVGGWSQVEEYAALKKHLDTYNPDQVILMMYPQNDIWENYERIENPTWRDTRLEVAPFGRTVMSSLYQSESIKNLLYDMNVLHPFRQFSVFKSTYDKRIERGWAHTKHLLQEIRNLVLDSKSTLGVISAPSPWQVDRKWRRSWRGVGEDFAPNATRRMFLKEKMDMEKPVRLLSDFLSREDIPYLSLFENLRSHHRRNDESLYFETVDHWNPEGHSYVSDPIRDFVEGMK